MSSIILTTQSKLKRAREGYLLIDHGNSPGVPDSMIQAAAKAGKFFPQVGAGKEFESATVTCAHCNTVVIMNPDRTRARGYCSRCDHYVCDSPACNKECVPFKQVLDTLYAKAMG